jgi:hypothetical protein
MERYREDQSGLKELYGIDAISEQSIRDFRFDSVDLEDPRIREDDLEFLRLIARTYYTTIVEAFKRYDTDHMLLGDKYKLYDHPDCVLEEAAKFMDILCFQPGQGAYGMPLTENDAPKTENDFDHLLELDRIYERFGKPIYICDHHLSFKTDEYPRTQWYQYPDYESQAMAYDEYINKAFKRPYIIGYGRCQFHTMIFRNSLAKQGIIKAHGEPFSEHLEAVSRTNQAVLSQIYGSLD